MSNEELEVEIRAIPHNSKCRYGERGAAAAGAVLKPQGGNCAVLPYGLMLHGSGLIFGFIPGLNLVFI